ncbi:MAG: hypothetical protein ACLQPH_16790 [Acidimicrobiales bacterium]
MHNPTTASTSSAPRRTRLRSRTSPSVRRVVALTALGIAAVTLAACGSSSSASTTSSSPSGTRPAGSGSGSTHQIPGTSGTIAAITGTSFEVQNPTTGQTTVSYTPTTTFRQTVTTTASAVTVGSCLSAFGKPTSTSSSGSDAFGGPVTATTVTITQPTSGSCTGGIGGFGGRPGGFPGGGSASAEGGSGFHPPSGVTHRFGNGQFGAASGMVTAVTGSSVTVNETNPQTQKTTSVVVTLTGSTTFESTGPATSSALATGQCARAVGPAGTTGAVTATSITVSQPVNGSCTGGFGGFRGGAGGPGGAAGGSTAGA